MVLFLANLGLELQKSQPVTETIHKVSVTSEKLPDAPTAIAAAPLTCPPCQSVMAPKETKPEAPKLSVPQRFGSAPFFHRMEPALKKILGRYEGTLSFFAGDRRGKIESVVFIVNLRQEAGTKRLNGNVQITITDENGKAYSKNAGNGGNKIIKYAAQERVVYIEASPSSFFVIKEAEFDRSEIRADYYDEDKFVARAVVIRQ